MTNTILELQATANKLQAALTAVQSSRDYFKYILDATDEDIATALQLEITVKDLQEQLNAVKATIKIVKKSN